MTCILDASMTLSFVLTDEYDAEAEQVLTAVASAGALVPALWDYEVLNGLRSAERRGRITEAGITHAVRGLAGLPIQRARLPHDGVHLISLARRHEISVYDAAYLWLAIEANLPLATRDDVLARAAAAAGVTRA